MRILLIEDDALIAAVVRRGMEEARFSLDVATDGETGLRKALIEPYGLIILDLMLPERDGWSVCETLRARRVTTPILMLTARDGVHDRVAGLDAGADDYLVKPFAVVELAARMRALLRRNRPADMRTYADLAFDPGTRTVERGGRSIQLTAREAGLLDLLLRRPGHVVTRRAALAGVWDDGRAASENVVDRYVAYLRQKLGDPPLIHTVRGAGYVLRR